MQAAGAMLYKCLLLFFKDNGPQACEGDQPIRLAFDAGQRTLCLCDGRAAGIVLDALVPVLAPPRHTFGRLEAPELAAS